MPIFIAPPDSFVRAPVAGLGGRFNGLSFGPGSDVHVAGISGLDDLPPIRSADSLRGGDDGEFAGIDLLSGRTVTIDFVIICADNEAYVQKLQEFLTAMATTRGEVPLYVNNSTRMLNARVRRRLAPYAANKLQRTGRPSVEFFCTDPRIYDAMPTTVTVAVATPSGGATFPWTFPLTFGTSGTGGAFQVINEGNARTYPTAHIAGPVDNPRVEHTALGRTVELAISLGDTDYLDLDFQNRSIVLNGSANRRNALTPLSEWFDLVPGVNLLRYAANTVLEGSELTFSFRSAWI